MHFPVIGECLGWRTTDFEELYGDLGQWTMTKELAREVSGFYLSSHCEVWWIAESVLNMSRSRADGTTSSWLLYFRNCTNFHTVSYIIWTPLWTKYASAAAILSNISANVISMVDAWCRMMVIASTQWILTSEQLNRCKNVGNLISLCFTGHNQSVSRATTRILLESGDSGIQKAWLWSRLPKRTCVMPVFSQPTERYNSYKLDYFIDWRNNLNMERYQ